MSDITQAGSKVGALLTPELIEAIKELFPRLPININSSEREIWLTEGQCTVIDTLQAKYDETHENILNLKVLLK